MKYRLDQEHQATEESITALQATIEDKVGVQQTLKAQADAVTKQNAELKETDQGTCPVCEQPLTPAHRTAMLERNESRLATMRADYRAARDEVDAARAKLKEAQAALTKLSEQQRRLPRPGGSTGRHVDPGAGDNADHVADAAGCPGDRGRTGGHVGRRVADLGRSGAQAGRRPGHGATGSGVGQAARRTSHAAGVGAGELARSTARWRTSPTWTRSSKLWPRPCATTKARTRPCSATAG
ncbi:MAG: hypothetical protein R2851_14180 [Caldilineaceae bacterium]